MSFQPRLIVSAVLAAAVLAVYAPVAHYDFIALDDAQYVRDNEHVNHGFSWPDVKWAFESVVAGNWHPVTMLSHMADCQIYGVSPGGQHFTNLLLHTVNTVLLFWLLLIMTGRRKSGEQRVMGGPNQKVRESNLQARAPDSNLWPCALVAALFGLHPLHVESVAWIAERKDVLSGFFALLTLWNYVKYGEKAGAQTWKSPVNYALALLMFALGLMSKSMLVTLPFVMLLLDYWPLARLKTSTFRLLLLEKVPFFALTIAFCAITYLVQKNAGAVVALKYFPLPARLANAMVSYAHYLEKTFWPASLAMLYPYHHWTAGQIAGSTALFVGISIAAVWVAPRKPYIFVGWFWFAGMLVPVIGLVQVGLQAMADHYTYLPVIGIFIAVAWGLDDLAARAIPVRAPGRPIFRDVQDGAAFGSLRRTMLFSAAIIIVVAVSAASAIQARYWKNSKTLFTHAVSVTGHNTVARYILGALYDSDGKTEMAEAQFTDAIEDDPGNVKALCGLGYILCNEGKLDEAAAQYQAALRVAPDLAKAHFGLAEVLMKQHDGDQAMREFTLALQANPENPEARYQLAALYSAKGEAASSISQLEEAVRLAPDWPLALNNLAWMRATERDSRLRNGSEAARLAMQAVTLTGKRDPSTLDTLAAAYAESGQFDLAAQTAQVALQTARAGNETNLAMEIQRRLRLYQTRQPYRE